MHRTRTLILVAACASACATLSACGGGGGGGGTGGSAGGTAPPFTPPAALNSFSLGGSAGTFTGTLELQASISGVGTPASAFALLSQPGSFSFPQSFPAGSAYSVQVLQQPPAQKCTVANGSGTLSANVANLQLSCGPGQQKLLFSFSGQATGITPSGPVTVLSNGDLLVETALGGAQNNGAVVQISPTGAETLLHSFTAASDGTTPQGGLVQGSDGNWYGVTNSGGSYGDGTAFRMTPQGAVTVMHSFGASGTAGATGVRHQPRQVHVFVEAS